MSDINFTDSLKYLRPLYYHFLDEFINNETGSSIACVQYMFIKYRNLFNSNIKILLFDNSNYYQYSSDIRLYKFLGPYLDINKESFNNIFKYCIFHLGCDKHAQSILFRVKDDKMYIECFNSGSGIELFKKELKVRDNDKYYLPSIPYILSNNINEDIDKDFDNLVLKIKGIISISILHNQTKNNRLSFINDKLDNREHFDSVLHLLNLLDPSLNFEKIGFNVLIEGKNIFDNINDDYTNTNVDINNLKSYYEIIMNLFKNNLPVENILIRPEFNVINSSELLELNDNTILHYFNGRLYIKPQQSGSCTWFSIYWPILFYDIYNDNVKEYKETILKIYNFFNDKLKEIFTKENFNKETKNYLIMKMIYCKFIDIGLLKDKELLENEIDFIYNRSIDTDSFKNLNSINIYEYTTQIQMGQLFNNFSNYFYSLEKENMDKFLSLMNIYQIYKYSIANDTELFKECDNINEILSNFSKFDYQTYPRINENMINNIIKLYLSFSSNNMHVFKYIDTCEYLINLNNDKNINIINLCNFIHRFNLFVDILINIKTIYMYITIDIENPKSSDQILILKNELYILNDVYTLINTFINKKTPSDAPNRQIIFNNDDFKEPRYYYNYNIFANNFRNQTIEKYFIDYRPKPNESLDNTNIITYYNRSFENYNKYTEFLYMNPKYIYQTFNNENYKINDCNFIKLHIHNIFKNSEFHNNLIIFFAVKYYELYNSKIDNDLFWIIANLQILLTMYIGFYDFNLNILNIDKNQYNRYIYESYKYSLTNFISFSKIIENYYKLHDSKEDFYKYLILNKKKLLDPYALIINKHINGTFEGDDDDKIFIDSDCNKYTIFNSSKDFVLNYFNVCAGDLFLFNKENKKIIIINFDYYIYIQLKDNNFIKEIKFNNYKIEKYSELSDPFKYVIPTNCLHLIYKTDSNEYNITYFINNNYEDSRDPDGDPILGKSSLNTYFYTIIINKNNMMFPTKDSYNIFTDLCRNYHINKLNIIYLNDFSEDFKSKKNTFLYYNRNVHKLYNFNKEKFLKQKLKKINYNKINFIKNIEKYNNFQIKISNCYILENDIILKKFESYIEKHKNFNKGFQEFIKDRNIDYIFDNYDKIYEYLLNIKVINSLQILIEIIKSKNDDLIINFCSRAKIFNEYFLFKEDQFNYNFEALFELISGNELLKEQMYRYKNILKIYKLEGYTKKKYVTENEDNTLLYNQMGGKFYPLNHFMMGKGKSAIITPMLSLFFSLKHNKNVIIVVPAHLEKQTHKTMDEYCHIFNIQSKVKILNDSVIKKYYLSDVFSNIDNSDTIMLIDEFDSILDPIKSNFNIIINKTLPITNLYKLFRIGNKLPESKNIEDGIIDDNIFPDDKNKLIKDEINNTIIQINNNKLIENINWGIHPKKGYAIPFRSKGNPLLNSNFSSSVLTVYLTLYYFVVIKNYEIDNLIVNYLIINNLFNKIFKTIKEPIIITLDYIINLINVDCLITKNDFFELIFNDIFTKILLPEERYNTSFVDILSIPNLFKIGYSGTINIDLPKLNKEDKFDNKHIEEDPDEQTNIKYAILNNDTKSYYDKDYIPFINENDRIKLDIYDALIDTIGLYKEYNNETIATYISKKFENRRNIIFIDESDNIYVLINGKKENYNSTNNYIKPFIYYSQSHIVGIDIKQDNYPILKGLCIIDENSVYSNIAQAMFRLRKLNIGHSIDFINNDKFRTKEEIFYYINENEEILKKNKKKYLLFQTLKSEVRFKTLKNTNNTIYNRIDFIENSIESKENIKYNEAYKEKVKYYYNDYNIDVDKIIKEIITNFTEEDKKYEYYDKIKDDLINLIYNINSKSSEQEQEKEQEKETLQNNVNTDLHVINYNNQLFEYINYNFENIILSPDEFINSNNTIKLNEDIYCLPNFDTQINGYEFKNNKIGILFVYIHEKLLIIPGYLLIEFNE